jgi:hypothetical protein
MSQNNDNQIKLTERIEKTLTKRERDEYVKYVNANKPPLSPKTSAELYGLFLAGSSCEEIARLNPGLGLGIIVKARIDFDWDGKKEEYINNLFSTIKEKTTQTQLEAIEFSATSMAVFHKLWNTRFKKFLQTGDESELGDLKNMSFKVYKEISEGLLKLTGQDKKQQVISGEVVHKIEDGKTLAPSDAANILKIIDGSKK